MKTSWRETKKIEAYLQGRADTGTTLLFEAQLLLDDKLVEKLNWQKRTHAVVLQYSRLQLKQEIEAVHQHLFNMPQYSSFTHRILSLFKKK